jgi:hypothetical protein
MVASHAVCRAIVLRSTPIGVVLGLAACLGLVGAAAAAEIAGNAAACAALRSSDSLRYPAAIQPAYDPYIETASTRTVSDAVYTTPDEPASPPVEMADADQQPPAICDAAREKPPGQLTINITAPAGLVPRDHAAECWPEIAGAKGTNPLVRCWPSSCYRWTATCLAYQPLYFEEINLERHGYGLGDLCQPFVSGAHFFGTVPCLPYLMAVNPPGECIYTLGHYRPGSCPPWQHHWPPVSAVGAFSEGSIITGLIFLIP